ncbi:MAG: hypothetical protein LBP58_00025, partial [Azoarcus sp.]|nr:hypothetical protein [Azoarcus sp.]
LYLQGNDDILPLPLQKMITKTISLFYLINVLRIVQDRLHMKCITVYAAISMEGQFFWESVITSCVAPWPFYTPHGLSRRYAPRNDRYGRRRGASKPRRNPSNFRHCERSAAIHRLYGLPRRCAPRNDAVGGIAASLESAIW